MLWFEIGVLRELKEGQDAFAAHGLHMFLFYPTIFSGKTGLAGFSNNTKHTKPV